MGVILTKVYNAIDLRPCKGNPMARTLNIGKVEINSY
jgi:hypothetical protein